MQNFCLFSWTFFRTSYKLPWPVWGGINFLRWLLMEVFQVLTGLTTWKKKWTEKNPLFLYVVLTIHLHPHQEFSMVTRQCLCWAFLEHCTPLHAILHLRHPELPALDCCIFMASSHWAFLIRNEMSGCKTAGGEPAAALVPLVSEWAYAVEVQRRPVHSQRKE